MPSWTSPETPSETREELIPIFPAPVESPGCYWTSGGSRVHVKPSCRCTWRRR